ncbi:hypothetical protein P5V15_014548 [Pogonomyrmex californicus]
MHSAEFLDIMDCLAELLANTKMFVKCLMFWLNQQKFNEILTMMKEDWADCVDNNINMLQTASKAKTSNRITSAILIFHTISVVGYSTGVLLADVDVSNHTGELPLITKIELSFDINAQRTYKSIVMTEFILLILSTWTAGAMNALILTMTLHVAGQINILRYWLKRLAPSDDESKNESIAIETTRIIRKHKKIIKFSENIESLFTYIALVLFASNMIMIGCLAFVVVTAVGSPNAVEQIIKSFLFYVLTNVEAYIFCYAGEHLKTKSKEIGLAAYNSTWYNMKSKNSRVLLFIILRSQKQLTLTVGKMMELSLQSFTSIINASGSYLSILLEMQ